MSRRGMRKGPLTLNRRLHRRLRRLDPRERAEPDFLVIGGQKCGTTALYDYLAEHPQVVPALKKQLNYFGLEENEHGLPWYRTGLPRRAQVERAAAEHGRAVTGEATPEYLFLPGVAERVASTYPNVRLIALLRDPVDRAYSHYHHQCRRGGEPLSFEAALDHEWARTDAAWRELQASGGRPDPALLRYSYQRRGHYAEQLARWQAVFPPEQLLVMPAEQLWQDPAAALRRVTEFLDLAPPPDGIAYHAARSGHYEALDPAVRGRLREHFRPHNEALYRMPGLDWRWEDD
jgi:hypothetical protein